MKMLNKEKTGKSVLYLENKKSLSANNIQTEYEEKFSEKGFTINYLEARLK